ncbi:LRR_1 domain-containing protein/LRRNT_2 domain-containing protein, partial [Cephalotus follicularis]
ILASWKADTDCCDWYCVTCDDTTNRINSLTIFSGNLPGQIPDAVGDLPYLENLEFHHLTNLTGPIPSGLANLKKLKMITISYTNISGSVPAWLSQLNNLILLDLSFNQLSGTIPSSLSQLTNLLALHLDRNSLTGSIPESFGQFRGNIPDLYLSHNQLTGEIPASLGDLDFNIIDFSSNKLTGDASFLFGAKKTTIWVILSRNKLGFNLSEVEFASTLTNVDLNHNMIYGSIPEAVTALPLQLWNVSYNRL